MEAEMGAQKEAIAEYQARQADLTAQQEEVEAVLLNLSADSAEYEDQIASISSMQSDINGRISDMENQLAELERIKAEQAAAAAAAANQSSSSGGSVSWYSDSTGTATGQEIVDYAETFLGVPYVYGGPSPSGFDCSGLVYYCYTHYGYTVNRTAAGLAYSGTEASASDLQPGDVILFTSSGGSYIGHTGIYIGDGNFIHAPHTGDVVKISSLSETYYTNHYWGARRVVSG
jgi:cell wall-associated NlpC family hydrolase